MDYILLGKLYENFYIFENTIKYHLNKILLEINSNFLTTTLKANFEKNILSIDYLEYLCESFPEIDLSHFTLQGLMSELNLIKSIRTKNISELTLGFYIQLFKWENVIRLCKELRIYEYEFLDRIFNEQWRGTNIDNMLKNNDLYQDFTQIQNYRNEFCHFRLIPKDYIVVNNLLCQYNSLFKRKISKQ